MCIAHEASASLLACVCAWTNTLTLAITFNPEEIELSYCMRVFVVTQPFIVSIVFYLATLTLKFDLLLKNFNLGHNFQTRRDRVFILNMCKSLWQELSDGTWLISMSSTKIVFLEPIGKNGHPGLWLAETFSASLKLLNRIHILKRKQDLNVLYQIVFFGPIRKTRWPPRPLIGCDTSGWDTSDFSSETAEWNSTKPDMKHCENVRFKNFLFDLHQLHFYANKVKFNPSAS